MTVTEWKNQVTFAPITRAAIDTNRLASDIESIYLFLRYSLVDHYM